MSALPAFPADALAERGLNRLHVFDLAALPETLRQPMAPQPGECRAILIGHAGRRLWDCIQADGRRGPDPIDDHTRDTLRDILARHQPETRWRLVYPGDAPVGLQALGHLAGWHHPSPFAVGVDAEWGSWFAYRALLLCDTPFTISPVEQRTAPCPTCPDQPCLGACPAGATGWPFKLQPCMTERLRPGSACAENCLARQACPVGTAHRYDPMQIRHSYRISLAMLRQWANTPN